MGDTGPHGVMPEGEGMSEGVGDAEGDASTRASGVALSILAAGVAVRVAVKFSGADTFSESLSRAGSGPEGNRIVGLIVGDG